MRTTFLFAHDLGERTLTHRLAVHLEKQFPAGRSIAITTGLARAPCGFAWNDRLDDDISEVDLSDIVVHSEIPNNLLAIE